MVLKTCSQCSKEKDIDDFGVDLKSSDQRRAQCKECKNASDRKAYEESRDDPESVGRRIIKKCKQREKERLAKFIMRRDDLDELPEVELTEDQFDIDLEWVLQQRDKQGNKCHYLGLEMIWSTGLIDGGRRVHPLAVTIERIDSSGPYKKSNCVLACWWANCAKNCGTVQELVDFSFEVVKKYVADNNLKLFIKQ